MFHHPLSAVTVVRRVRIYDTGAMRQRK